MARHKVKLSPSAWGPYTFNKYGKTHTTDEIRNQATGKHVVSLAHLRLMMVEWAIRMQCYPFRQMVDVTAAPSYTLEEPSTESSTKDSEPEVIQVRDRKRSW